MADNKTTFTATEIKKALECCGNYKCTPKCPMYENGPSDADVCAHQLIKMSIDLINRKEETIEALIAGQETLQKALAEKNAEIEKLKNECFCIANECDAISDCLNTAVAEAIKEFDNKLREKAGSTVAVKNGTLIPDSRSYYISERELDILLKEMVGEQ